MFRKVMLLASMALAVVAFAAPAAQAEPAWWIDDETETIGDETEAGAFDVTGDITSTVGHVTTTANLTLDATVWNGSSMGEGALTPTQNGTGVIPPVPPAICQVHMTFPGAPWDITLTTDEDPETNEHSATIDIEDATFINHYSHGCRTLITGLVTNFGASGDVTVTAEWDTETTNLSLSIEESHMKTPGNFHMDLHTNPDPLVSDDGVGVEQ